MHFEQYLDRPLIPAVKIVLDHFVALTKSDMVTSSKVFLRLLSFPVADPHSPGYRSEED
jgi:hypothetical protein